MWKHLASLLLVGLLAVALVACGGDDDDDDGDATPSPTTGDATATPTDEEPEDTVTPEATETPGNGDGGDLPDFVDPGTVEADEDLEPEGIPQLVDVRIGENEGYDRIVFEFEGDELPPWEVMYVSQPTACGSGKPVTTGGTAHLQVNMFIAQAHTPDGELTIPSTEIVSDYPAIVEGVQTCDFEALVTWVAGTRGTLPFRAFTLEEPTRLVVDIEHP